MIEKRIETILYKLNHLDPELPVHAAAAAAAAAAALVMQAV